MSYYVDKSKILKYIDDRNDYMKIYEDLSLNIQELRKITAPYDYVPKTLVLDFLSHFENILKEHKKLFDQECKCYKK